MKASVKPKDSNIKKQPLKPSDLKKISTASIKRTLKFSPAVSDFNKAEFESLPQEGSPLAIPLSHHKTKDQCNSASIDTLEDQYWIHEKDVEVSFSAKFAKIQRKDSRSRTEINPPPVQPEYVSENHQYKRRTSRNKTEIPLLEKKTAAENKINISESTDKKNDINKQNLIRLSSNYKIEQTPSRVYQKEKLQISNPFEEASESRHHRDHEEIFSPKSNTTEKSPVYKCSQRSSVVSNVSNGSVMMSEVHLEILNGLTKSVKDLNQRLIKSEEVIFERLKENLDLKNTVKRLESKIDEHSNHRIDSTSVKPGCSANCILI